MENIIKTLKLSEAVLKGVANFPELDTTQKHLIGHTLKMLNESLAEAAQLQQPVVGAVKKAIRIEL
jgi:hypothetical protein